MFCNTFDGGKELRIFHDFQIYFLQRRELVVMYLRTLPCCISPKSDTRCWLTILPCVYSCFTFSSSLEFCPETDYQPKCLYNYRVFKKILYRRDNRTYIIIAIIFIVVIAVVLSVLRRCFLQGNVYSNFFQDDSITIQSYKIKKANCDIACIQKDSFCVTGIIFYNSYLFLGIPVCMT